MRFARDCDAITKWVKKNKIPNPEFLIDIVVKYDARVFAKLLDAVGKTVPGVPLLFLVDSGVYIYVVEEYESFLEFGKNKTIQIIPESAIHRVREIPINAKKIKPPIKKPKSRLAIKNETLNTWLVNHPPTQEKTYNGYYTYYRNCSTDHFSSNAFIKRAKVMYPSIGIMNELTRI